MYCSGLNPNIEMLYNPISYPVASGTPPLHTLCSWNHEEVWSSIDLTILVCTTIYKKKYVRFNKEIIKITAKKE